MQTPGPSGEVSCFPAEVKGPEADQGGLEKAHPFSLRDQWFESISLQRRVIQTSSSTHRPIRRDGSEGQAAFVGTFARLTQHETTTMPLQRPVVDRKLPQLMIAHVDPDQRRSPAVYPGSRG